MRVFILKPDAIGDFILATGCIRHLARAKGEKNLVIAVRADVAPLAVSEFPEAEIIPLPLRLKRRVLNLALVNILNCLPAWGKMAMLRVDAAICLRSMRAYLHTFFFCSPRANRRIACENLLLSKPRVRRPVVEKWMQRLFCPTLLKYPDAGCGLPLDIEANRIVLEELLGEPVSPQDVMPTLNPRSVKTHDFWVLAPFSSTPSKDYPAPSWARALREIQPRALIRLAASPSQQESLRKFARELAEAGLEKIEFVPPSSLPEFVQTIAAASLVLTVDTAAAHMACATGTPAVIVSAGQHPGVYAPYSPNGKQAWLLPSANLPKGAWRQEITSQKIALAVRDVLGQ